MRIASNKRERVALRLVAHATVVGATTDGHVHRTRFIKENPGLLEFLSF